MSEKRLQANIIKEYSQRYPNKRGRLFATFSETTSVAQGSNRIALGLIRGVSDLILVDDNKHIIGIELKEPNSRHKTDHVIEQCQWLDENTKKGCFCTSVAMFWDIYNGGNGITTDEVRKMCGNKKNVKF